jgi:hypothetical protein
MAHQYQAEIKEIISGLRDLAAQAQNNLAPVPAFQNRVTVTLRQLDNYLSHIIGEPLLESTPTRKFGPIVLAKKEEPAASIPIKSVAQMEGEQLKKTLRPS